MKLYPLDLYRDALVELVFSYLLVALATIAVFFRCWARRMKHVDLWIDDYSAISALFFLWILVAMQTADGRLGIRTHTKDLPAENLQAMLKVLFSGQILYSVCLLLGKSSYVFFYRRIFVTKSFKMATWAVLAVICAWFTGNILQVFLICRPLASNWDPSVKATCGNRPLVYVIMGSINVATDAVIMILPVPYIRQLQMSTSSKVGVSTTFLFGLLICIVSITRTNEVFRLDYSDPSYELLTTNFWSTVEPALLIANSCIPLLRPPLQSILSRFWTRTRTATQYALGSQRDLTKLKSVTRGLSSRWRAPGHGSAVGKADAQHMSHMAQIKSMAQDDDDLEMGSTDSHSTVGLHTTVLANLEEKSIEAGNIEPCGIIVKKDWSVTNEKARDDAQ